MQDGVVGDRLHPHIGKDHTSSYDTCVHPTHFQLLLIYPNIFFRPHPLQNLHCQAILAYVFFGIYFLVIDYHVCPGSPLWWWCLVVLTAFILSVPLGIYHTATTKVEEIEDLENDKNSKDDLWWKLVSMIVFQGSLCIAGHIIMTDGYTCGHLQKTGLWTWAKISMHKLTIVTVYVLLVFIFMFYIMPYMNLDGHEGGMVSATVMKSDKRASADERDRLLDDSNNGKDKGGKSGTNSCGVSKVGDSNV